MSSLSMLLCRVPVAVAVVVAAVGALVIRVLPETEDLAAILVAHRTTLSLVYTVHKEG